MSALRVSNRVAPLPPGEGDPRDEAAWEGEGTKTMHIVSMTRFVIGIVFLVLAIVLFFRTRGERGFGQMRQAALLSLIGAGYFAAVGLGYLESWS